MKTLKYIYFKLNTEKKSKIINTYSNYFSVIYEIYIYRALKETALLIFNLKRFSSSSQILDMLQTY